MGKVRERIDRFLEHLADVNDETFGPHGPDCCGPNVKTSEEHHPHPASYDSVTSDPTGASASGRKRSA